MSDQVNQPADLSDTVRLAAWQIKDFPVELRLAAIECARRAQVNVAEWVADAVRAAMGRSAGVEFITPPDQRPAPPSNGTVALPPIDLHGLGTALNSIVALAEAAKRDLIPHGLVSSSVATVNAHMRAARGLPPLKTRKPASKPATIEHEHPIPNLPPALDAGLFTEAPEEADAEIQR